MKNINNKNELKERIELCLNNLNYFINETFYKKTLKMMLEYIEHTEDYRDAEEQGLIAKVVHGEWVDVNGFTFMQLPDGHKWCECSNCNFEIMDIPYNYCPNCGAKMDGGKE